MMNKLYKFSAFAALLAGVALSSCNNEEADIFDQSAAHRTEQAKQMYKDILVDQGGKWQMEYFTTEEEHGYVYIFTFKEDGSVKISGHNEYITKITNIDANYSSFGSEESLWDVISDNGPVLTFNSYNKYFHLFADPEDVPDTEPDEQGYGHSGDYEFDLMKFSNDTLYLEGKKHGASIIMTRIPSTTDDETYLNEVVALADSFFNAKIPAVYVNLPGGYRHVVLDGATQLPKFYPETGDYITEWVGRNAIITHDGFTLGSPLTLRDSIDGKDYTIQHFIRQADGSLLCTDDGKTTITADALSKVVTNQALVWQIDATQSTGELGEAFNAISTGTKAFNGSSITYIKFGAVTESGKKYPNAVFVRLKLKAAGKTLNIYQEMQTEVISDDEFRFVLGDMEKNMATYVTKVPELQAFLEMLGNTTFKCSSSSLLAPVNIRISDVNNPSSSLMLNLQ